MGCSIYFLLKVHTYSSHFDSNETDWFLFVGFILRNKNLYCMALYIKNVFSCVLEKLDVNVCANMSNNSWLKWVKLQYCKKNIFCCCCITLQMCIGSLPFPMVSWLLGIYLEKGGVAFIFKDFPIILYLLKREKLFLICTVYFVYIC